MIFKVVLMGSGKRPAKSVHKAITAFSVNNG